MKNYLLFRTPILLVLLCVAMVWVLVGIFALLNGQGINVLLVGIVFMLGVGISSFFFIKPYLSPPSQLDVGVISKKTTVESNAHLHLAQYDTAHDENSQKMASMPTTRNFPRGKWYPIIIFSSIVAFIFMNLPIDGFEYPQKFFVLVCFVLLLILLQAYSAQKNLLQIKAIKRDPMITVVTIIAIVSGIYIWISGLDMVYFAIPFVFFFITVIVRTSTTPLISSEESIKRFADRKKLMIVKNPQITNFPTVFYNNMGIIPFDDVKDFMKINDSFFIFMNRYAQINPYVGGYNFSNNSTRLGRLEPQNHFCLLFKIGELKGYHRLLLKSISTNLQLDHYGLLQGDKLSRITSKNKVVDDNYALFSSFPVELDAIISRIFPLLITFPSVFTENNIYTIDFIPAMMEIHLTNQYCLVRSDYLASRHIDELYALCAVLQEELS